MRSVLFGLLLALSSAVNAQTVEYKIAFLSPGTNSPVTQIKVGQQADVALYVRDVRPAGDYVNTATGKTMPLVRGVFAAYCDLRFNYDAVQVVADSFHFSDMYPNGKETHAAKGLYDDTGSFAASFSGLGTVPCEVFRFRIKGVKVGTGTFAPSLDVARPKYSTLVYGNLAADPPEQSNVEPEAIKLTPSTIRVLSPFR